MKRYLQWNELDYLWTDIKRGSEYMGWYDIALIEEVAYILRGGGGIGDDGFKEYVDNNPWKKLTEEIGEEKTEKFIKIFCTVNGMEYEKSKMIKENVRVSVSQFEKVFNEYIKVKAVLKS